VRASSGNASQRYDEERMLATATGARLADLSPDQVAVCRVADGVSLNQKRPTVEIALHAGVLRARPDAAVVLHFQSPCATTVACRRGPQPDFDVIPEMPFHVGPVAGVPYLAPGTAELAEAVAAAAARHDLVVLGNHGAVCVGRDFRDAIQKAEFFELACEILLRSNGDAAPLPPGAAGQLRERARNAEGRRAPGAA
jgi:ribulose-5-phosphate 4-epimerase/fuculose-1-phosphate aldolase